jgi:hypothetical protein
MHALKTAVLVTASVLVLAGCVDEPPGPVDAPALPATAALLTPQVDAVVSETMAEIAAADAEKSADSLTVRVGGDAATVRAAEYKVATGEDAPQPQVLPAEMQAVYVSSADVWPRVFATVSVQPSDTITPVIMLWVQDDIDSPYQMRGWAHMIPGATLPAMPGPTSGALQLPLTDSGVTPDPLVAVNDYLELLRQGADSELNDAFAPDSYRDRLFAARDVLTKAAKDADGAYVDTVQSDESATYALSTADGGALVFAPVAIASAFSVENATVSIPAVDEPLLTGDLESKVTHHYQDMIVMYIPGPGAEALPAVVGADHQLVRVTAK